MAEPQSFPFRITELRCYLFLEKRVHEFSSLFRRKFLELIKANLEVIASGTLPASRFRFELYLSLSQAIYGHIDHPHGSEDPQETRERLRGLPIDIHTLANGVHVGMTDNELVDLLWRNGSAPNVASTSADAAQEYSAIPFVRLNLNFPIIPTHGKVRLSSTKENEDVSDSKAVHVTSFIEQLFGKRARLVRQFINKPKKGEEQNDLRVSTEAYIATLDSMLSIYANITQQKYYYLGIEAPKAESEIDVSHGKKRKHDDDEDQAQNEKAESQGATTKRQAQRKKAKLMNAQLLDC
ncbi:hypothetical protein M426DRAFT_13266 [Hypoxylon sp. CI-4A]|nr:hypothetical protein M426DRAFT_13266 [Hypoxylon sp. CI-4A]